MLCISLILSFFIFLCLSTFTFCFMFWATCAFFLLTLFVLLFSLIFVICLNHLLVHFLTLFYGVSHFKNIASIVYIWHLLLRLYFLFSIFTCSNFFFQWVCWYHFLIFTNYYYITFVWFILNFFPIVFDHIIILNAKLFSIFA